jgi:hypothetical protein
MAVNRDYATDSDPLKRAEYWLHALAWLRGDKFKELEALAKEVKAEREKRDALRARAEAAEGMREALEQIVEIPVLSKQSPIYWNNWAKETAYTALTAWQAAQGKGE